MIRRILNTISCGLLLAVAHGQNIADTAADRLGIYQRNVVSEKIYVQTDKTLYLPGQVLWFKAYVVDASTHRLLGLSKVAYVEVLDSGNRPLLQGKIALANGEGDGSFLLPASCPTGNYRLRAYTAWMKNSSPEFFYEQGVTIVNPNMDPVAGAVQAGDVYDIQFFPEGGDMVVGLPSKVGFRIADRQGKDLAATGRIVDESGRTVQTFTPFRFGLGHFDFQPELGHQYTALVRIGDTVVSRPLRQALGAGFTMSVIDTTAERLLVRVRGRGVSDRVVYLLVHNRGRVTHTAALELQGREATLLLDKSALGEGVLHLTLFDDSGHPLAERLAFVYPTHGLHIDAVTDSTVYDTRSKVTVSVATDLTASLSMSVALSDSLAGAGAEDIASYLWLRSDLRGDIASPGYYFDTTKADRAEALDNLLITQGWSRWRWQDVLFGRMPEVRFLPEYEGHQITGVVTDKQTGRPAAGIPVYVSLPGKAFRLGAALSDVAGRVVFNLEDFFGGNEVVLQLGKEHNGRYRFDMDDPFSLAPVNKPPPAFRVPARWYDAILFRSVNTQVMNVFPSGRQHFRMDRDTLPLFIQPDASYPLDDYTRFRTLEEVFREYVPEVAVSKTGSGYRLRVETGKYLPFFRDAPLMLVDGVPYFNEDTVLSLDPIKIKRLDVITERYYSGPLFFDGVMSLTTYQGDLSDFRLDPAALVVDYDALQPGREFYAPVYDKGRDSRVPDFRDVLAWQPRLSAGHTSFYTSDVPGTYKGVIMGIAKDGMPGVRIFTFTVKP